MYVDKNPRKDRKGRIYYSILYRDLDGKICRLPKDQHPHFDDFVKADSWAKSQEAIRSARAEEIKRKLAWKDQYYEFDELLQLYRVYQKEKAPNSWRSAVTYLEHWIFPFYLQEKGANNINDWRLFFQEFRTWLSRDDARVTKTGNRQLAVSTRNNIVKALNTFLKCLGAHNKISGEAVRECPAWEERLVNKRGWNDVIQVDEKSVVYTAMGGINPTAADFFLVLWHTGMRFAELFGLAHNWLYSKEMPVGPMRNMLDRHGWHHHSKNQPGTKYYGYIVLESQPANDDRKREDGTQAPDRWNTGEKNSIRRKPLKSCDEISAKYFRTIPIRDKEVWNILASRYAAQKVALANRKYTSNPADYPFFDDLEWNQAYNTLKKAYERLKLPKKEFHCCRHSFITFLAGETNDFAFVRAITGHRSARAFDRYLHIYEEIALKAQQTTEEIKVI